MLDARYATKFKHDVKLCAKRGLNIQLLQQAIDTLRIPKPLPSQNYDHILSGNYVNFHECHLQPDWLLIYKIKNSELYLYRTGTHADLFGK